MTHACRISGITYEILRRAVTPKKPLTGRERRKQLAVSLGVFPRTLDAYAAGARHPAGWVKATIEAELGPV